MPLTDQGLGAAIQTALTQVAPPTAPSELSNFANALGQAIVEYIKANAIVTGVVQTGQGAGGTVTGTVG